MAGRSAGNDSGWDARQDSGLGALLAAFSPPFSAFSMRFSSPESYANHAGTVGDLYDLLVSDQPCLSASLARQRDDGPASLSASATALSTLQLNEDCSSLLRRLKVVSHQVLLKDVTTIHTS